MIMKAYIIGVLVLSTLLCSCKKDESIAGVHISVHQNFKVVNDAGNDLLDPENEGAIDLKKLKIYYVVDGERIDAGAYNRQRSPGAILDYPDGYSISKGLDGEYVFKVFLNDSMEIDGTISITYIEWDEDDIDTIKAKNTVRGSSFFESKMIQFNDIEVSREENDQYFTIVK